MSISFNAALNAYKSAAQISVNGSNSSQATQAAQSTDGEFGNIISNFASNTTSTLRKVDSTTANFLSKQADITDVVSAISKAEVTLKTVIEVRDRLVAAHQDIMKMPI